MPRSPRIRRAFNRRFLPDRGAALGGVIAIIDELHTDGALNRIALWYLAADDDAHGTFHRDRLTGEPFGISVRRDAFMALTFCHEVGHFLDIRGISGPGISYASETDSRLVDWRMAVRASDVWQRYRVLTADPFIPYRLSDGTIIEYPIAHENLVYVQQFREFFARSYAQWVATRSRDRLLLEQLHRWREKQSWILQWSDDDFAPIGTTLDRLFVSLGWRTDDHTNAD